MKIGKLVLTTEEKIYDRVRKAVLENENYYENKIAKLETEHNKKISTLEEHYEEKVDILIEQNRNLKDQRDEIARSRAGYKSRNTILARDRKALEEKIKELKSDRYLRRSLPKDKTQSHQQQKIKSSTVQSKIVKNTHEESL